MSDELQQTHEHMQAKLTDEEKHDQRRQWFREGWLLSGAPIEKCDAWFRAIDSARALPDRILQMADYDDSEQALGRQRAAQLERLEEYERSRQSAADDTDLTGI